MPGFKLIIDIIKVNNINISLYDLLIECNFHITEARPKFSGESPTLYRSKISNVRYLLSTMKQTSNQLHTDIL